MTAAEYFFGRLRRALRHARYHGMDHEFKAAYRQHRAEGYDGHRSIDMARWDWDL